MKLIFDTEDDANDFLAILDANLDTHENVSGDAVYENGYWIVDLVIHEPFTDDEIKEIKDAETEIDYG